MGVTIEFYTKSEVTLDEVKLIVAATKEPNAQPWLLCEPIQFLDMPGFENQLFGVSKLNLMLQHRADAEANNNAEKNDLEFLIDKLKEISRRFKVDWVIQLEGAPIGAIENGECDTEVRDAVDAMTEVAGELGFLEGMDDLI